MYYYANEFGSKVYFDAVGHPWPKHPCTDNQEASSKNTQGAQWKPVAPRRPVALKAPSGVMPIGLPSIPLRKRWWPWALAALVVLFQVIVLLSQGVIPNDTYRKLECTEQVEAAGADADSYTAYEQCEDWVNNRGPKPPGVDVEQGTRRIKDLIGWSAGEQP
ncbi:hypothetical protein [Micromonospora sp. NPDC005707]|uniref:hypothetical protein n=1 Tax=Micromonospora sp. NPDC005707 TaxID=3157050 RepID=UPI00340239A0